jgi:hypothetical protein
MSGTTTRYAMAYPVAGDAVNQEPVTVKAMADKLDLLLGEGGSVTNSGAIAGGAVTYSQVINLARNYSTVRNAQAHVNVELTSVLSNPNVWVWWITAITDTSFTLNVQFTNAQAIGSRGFAWRFWPAG